MKLKSRRQKARPPSNAAAGLVLDKTLQKYEGTVVATQRAKIRALKHRVKWPQTRPPEQVANAMRQGKRAFNVLTQTAASDVKMKKRRKEDRRKTKDKQEPPLVKKGASTKEAATQKEKATAQANRKTLAVLLRPEKSENGLSASSLSKTTIARRLLNRSSSSGAMDGLGSQYDPCETPTSLQARKEALYNSKKALTYLDPKKEARAKLQRTKNIWERRCRPTDILSSTIGAVPSGVLRRYWQSGTGSTARSRCITRRQKVARQALQSFWTFQRKGAKVEGSPSSLCTVESILAHSNCQFWKQIQAMLQVRQAYVAQLTDPPSSLLLARSFPLFGALVDVLFFRVEPSTVLSVKEVSRSRAVVLEDLPSCLKIAVLPVSQKGEATFSCSLDNCHAPPVVLRVRKWFPGGSGTVSNLAERMAAAGVTGGARAVRYVGDDGESATSVSPDSLLRVLSGRFL